MGDLEALYLKLPTMLQHAACSLEGWRVHRSRLRGAYPGLLWDAESRTFWSGERLREHRDQRLREFVRHCAGTVPFYRRRFRECGVSPDDIRTLEDLGSLPILTKAEVQDHAPELISEAVPHREHIVVHTSGTTGGGLRFATTLRAVQEQWAVWWRYRRWHGLEPGTWCGYFGGRSVVPLTRTVPPYWRYNLPGKQILFSGYHMSPGNLAAYVGELRRRRPPWLHGYPSLLALLAAYLLETGTDLGYGIRWLTVGAENLLRQQAALMERAFGVRPRQHYGMAEGVANISECDQGRLHVDEDFAAVEFLPNPDGPGCKVVGTSFMNRATPLLRYDVQDVVTLSETTCSCGRSGRVVASVDGRLEDYVVLKSGARVGRMDHVFKDLTAVREAQISQERPGEIVVRIVRGRTYVDADERMLLREIRKRVGEETGVRIEYAEKLTRSRTGKLRFVCSGIAGEQAARQHVSAPVRSS